MSDASKHAGAKPRLSLFSSKQAVIRLKSDDQALDAMQLQSTVSTSDSPETSQTADRNETTTAQQKQVEQQTGQIEQLDAPDKETRLNGNTQNDLNKMNISKDDLMRIITILKSDLQSKEIALNAIKCEQLKRLINPVEISRSSLASTYTKLQDRLKHKDQNNNTKDKLSTQGTTTTKLTEQQKRSISQEGDHSGNAEENLNILIALLELLDQHPLLALPRDSIYCLDYSCNESSTKNYLNLKIQHLDSLIDQHRRFRYYMINRLQRTEQRLSEITSQLEFERSLKLENGKTIYGATGETVLLKRIEEVKEALNKEKRDKQVIVMTLLNELLDEKERASSFAERLAKSKSSQINEKSGEKEKMLILQSELDGLNSQLKKQAGTFASEREDMLLKMKTLRNENESLKHRIEQLEKRPMPSLKPSQQETKDTNRTSSPSNSPGKATISSKTINSSNSGRQQQASVNSPTATMRATKPLPTSRVSSSPNSSHATPAAQNAATSSSSPSVRSNTQTSPSGRSPAPHKSHGLAASSQAEQSTVKSQHLYKSASVISTHQQVRGQRTPTNSGPLVRSTSTSQATTKPQVPAKPAQLLDQQRTTH